ncbi:unnamed protein product [Caenorhabditis auriculariae]|uniref:Symplekin n=1 Tax=Caenorhabditis auriculariae TaxID=2777116 RepID=A0A8S1HPC5_9PELO|nr:unnamed protein product [Caenorhabditis auriculariae]
MGKWLEPLAALGENGPRRRMKVRLAGRKWKEKSNCSSSPELLEDGESASQRVADALRDAREGTTFDVKVKALAAAMQILVDPVRPNHLLDNFLDEMLEFGELREARVMCLIVDFLQKACAKDPEICPKALDRLTFYLTHDTSVPKYIRVVKRVIVACTNLYPIILEWVVKRSHAPVVEQTWEAFGLLKGRIMRLIDSDNDGVRTVTLKFLESMILCQSPKPKEEVVHPNAPPVTNELNTRFSRVSLNDVPRGHRFISFRKAQTEAEQNFLAMIKQTTIMHISAQNLLTAVDVLCMVARNRPNWDNALHRVVEAMEILHVNLPPTLGTSQVKSVRKELKRNLMRFLKLPAAVPFQSKISTLLVYLGSNPHEISKAIPAHLVPKVQKKAAGDDGPLPAKRAKHDEAKSSGLFDEDDEDEEPSTSQPAKLNHEKDAVLTAVDVTSQYVFERLNTEVVIKLVLISLMTLPEEMPPTFSSSYTPIAAAGTEEQRRDLSRMMATQATQAEVGPGFEQVKKLKKEQFRERQEARMEGLAIAPTPQHLPTTILSRKPPQVPFGALPPPSSAPVLKSKKALNLIEETKELTSEEMDQLFECAFDSVLRAERRVVQGGATLIYQQLVVRLTCRFREDAEAFENRLVAFIVEDHKKRTDLALLWLSELYAQYQGYSCCTTWLREQIEGADGLTRTARLERYDRVMCELLKALMEKKLHMEALFHKMLLDSPLVTLNALEYLKTVCLDKVGGAFGMTTLRELILTRNRQRGELLNFFFNLSFLDKPELRSACVDTAKELCALAHLRRALTEKAKEQLQECLEPVPPVYFRNPESPSEDWTEDIFRCALTLYLGIMPFDPSLLLPLADVYAYGTTTFKKVVLRSIEPAVKAIGMRDEQMLRLVEECPVGAETLVARIVHLLTERAPAIPELVVRVKRLHDERRTDVRALIPIIGGLSRDEVVTLLPQFVLRSEYQKSVALVFRRLYNARDMTTGDPCFAVDDLIVQYHLIQPQNEKELNLQAESIREVLDPRFVTKEAAAKAVEKLFESRPLPQIFMNTLVCIHEKFSQLESFLTNLLQKLVARKLWQHNEHFKESFFFAVMKLKDIVYGAVLTNFTYEEFTELVQSQGEEILNELKEFFPTMSTAQQKSMDQEIKDVVWDKEREEREKRERKEERREKERLERERDKNRDKDREREKEREKERDDRRYKSSRRKD